MKFAAEEKPWLNASFVESGFASGVTVPILNLGTGLNTQGYAVEKKTDAFETTCPGLVGLSCCLRSS